VDVERSSGNGDGIDVIVENFPHGNDA